MDGIRGPVAALFVASAAFVSAAEPAVENSTPAPVVEAISVIKPRSLSLAVDSVEPGKSEPVSSQAVGNDTSPDPEVKSASKRMREPGSANRKAAHNADGQKGTTAGSTRRKPLRRKIIVVKAAWCGACQSLNHEWPKLRKVRWRIGSQDTDHFQLVDVDENPDVVSRYGIAQLPTLLLVENGKVIGRTGALSAKDLAEFYYGRL